MIRPLPGLNNRSIEWPRLLDIPDVGMAIPRHSNKNYSGNNPPNQPSYITPFVPSPPNHQPIFSPSPSSPIPSTMTDPLKSYDSSGRPKPAAISQNVYNIAGISVTVYGLDELQSKATDVACLWLLHPRLATQARMTGIAEATINDWNGKMRATPSAKGLIAVSFDQRNHGARMVDPLANEAWRQGNPRHAQDMFSIFREYCLHGSAG